MVRLEVDLARAAGTDMSDIEERIKRPLVSRLRISPEVVRTSDLGTSLLGQGIGIEAHIRRQPRLYRNWHLLGEHLDDERGLVA